MKVSKVLKGFHATEPFLILTDSRGEIMSKPSEQVGTFTAQRFFLNLHPEESSENTSKCDKVRKYISQF